MMKGYRLLSSFVIFMIIINYPTHSAVIDAPLHKLFLTYSLHSTNSVQLDTDVLAHLAINLGIYGLIAIGIEYIPLPSSAWFHVS